LKVFADFHIHGKYARATSPQTDLENLSKYGKIKGLNLIGTGDFTHPDWLKDLKEKLEPIENTGIYSYNGMKFMLTTEVSTIYEQDNKTRKVHHVIHVPNFETIDQIVDVLEKKGAQLGIDGRLTLRDISGDQLVEILMNISKDILIIPAHCLLPEEYIHCNQSIKRIDKIKNGDKVYTHKNNWKTVKKVLKRKYKGEIFHIKPFYFSEGIKVTPEHPFFGIKTYKNCKSTKGFCKLTCSSTNNCRRKYFEKYKPEWIMAKNLENSDVLLYPRFNKIKDRSKIKISLKYNKKLKNIIKLDKDFCKLIGYYLSEGYTNSRDAVIFCISGSDIINEIRILMKKCFNFNIQNSKLIKKDKYKGTEIIFYSKDLKNFFLENFYDKRGAKAPNKKLPNWMLCLPIEKQKEIVKGWWAGDKGYTTSRILMNQMKIIFLRAGIIPSIRSYSKEYHNSKNTHILDGRIIKANHRLYHFSNLSFFSDNFDLLDLDDFKKFKTKMKRKHGWTDKNYIYIPIFKIKKERYEGYVYILEVEKDNSYVSEFAIVHNCWTPWFGVLGSKSGFDKVEDCYKDQIKYIYGLETGLSSDPAMNWRFSSLDKFTLMSNSDAHSHWPWRLGRECNVFDLKKITYSEIFDAVKNKDKKKFLFTIEVDPGYGKFHWTGHRNCKIMLSPEQALKLNDICPVCKRKLTVGVEERVEKLADRPADYKPKDAIPFKKLIPLTELIKTVFKVETLYSKTVWNEYMKLIDKFGNEFNILLNVPKEDLEKETNEKLAEFIILNRQEKIKVIPGYDGVYGVPVFEQEKFKKFEQEQNNIKLETQKTLKSF